MKRIGMSKRGKIYGVGFCSTKLSGCINYKHTVAYTAWLNMLKRSYDPYENDKHQTYRDVTVCKEWHDFKNFDNWFKDNYYVLDTGEKTHLDKDIIKPGNKVYCPEFCSYVPQSINKLILANESQRGKYPQGVILHKFSMKYNARLRVDNKVVSLGYFKTPKEAFEAYSKAKTNEIVRKVDTYKDVLAKAVVKSLMNYDITE